VARPRHRLARVLRAARRGTGRRLGREPAELRSGALLAAAGALIGFGWVYPHFLQTDTWLSYLYAAPAGLIPCPTLAVVIGASLAIGGLGSVAWSGVLCAMGAFYSLFGALHLGVDLDWVLLAGAVALLPDLFRNVRPA